MKKFSYSPSAMFKSFWLNRQLIKALSVREILSRYKGSLIGVVWAFVNPILMLIIYTFVFSVVFKSRWPGGSESKTEFALILFSGLIIFNLFSECLNRSPNLIISNVNFVKKVIFPLECLPWVSLIASLFHTFINLLVWVIAYILLFGLPHATIFLFPIVLLPIIFLNVGLGWMLASLGVYFRDLGQFVAMLSTVLMFLSPIFYPVTALPEEYQIYLKLNPITPAIEGIRSILFWGNLPDFSLLFINLVISLIICWLGFIWFQKTRKGFADVL
jgi:lipopolysaccharide transport system permease protein